jgi:hypothetical protein
VYHVSGTSHAGIGSFNDSDGGSFAQDVALNWDGYIGFNGRSLKRVAILAQGREKLTWRPDCTSFTSFQEFRELNRGRPIKMDGPVVFGFLGGDQPRQTAANTGSGSSASEARATPKTRNTKGKTRGGAHRRRSHRLMICPG